VAAADFVSVVINSDPSHVTPAMLENAAAKAREVVERNSLPLLVGNVADTARSVRISSARLRASPNISPDGSGSRGRRAHQARGLAERAINLADWLADMARRREERVPDEEKALRTKQSGYATPSRRNCLTCAASTTARCATPSRARGERQHHHGQGPAHEVG